jgi:LCP family protein required for cell wall assembly
VGTTGAIAWSALGSLESEAYDPANADSALADIPDDVREGIAVEVEAVEVSEATIPEDAAEPLEPYELPSTDNPFTVSPPLPDEMFDSYLLIGTDASGLRADVIMYVLVPEDGDPIIASIPRDLFMENRCTERYTRINATLNGCGDYVSGTTLLTVAVESFTGIAVDSFALVDFDGFEEIVDAVGGVDICFDYPTKDRDAGLDVDAGCQRLDGETALAWARSRKTLELRDGRWQGIGASDFSRQSNQQQLLFALADRVASLGSLGRFTQIASATADAVRLSEGFSITEAVGLAWQYRNIDPDNVPRIALETKPYTTSYGAYVLEPTRSFNELLAEIYPDAYREVVAAGG